MRVLCCPPNRSTAGGLRKERIALQLVFFSMFEMNVSAITNNSIVSPAPSYLCGEREVSKPLVRVSPAQEAPPPNEIQY